MSSKYAGRKARYQQFGEMGEEIAANELRRRGYQVEKIGGTSSYDHLINHKMTVEVKSATSSKGNQRGYKNIDKCRQWQFSFGRHELPIDEHLILLLCFDADLEKRPVFFIIPGAVLEPNRRTIKITTGPLRYSGKWAKYREAWAVVDEVLAELLDIQPELFKKPTEEEIPF